MPSQAIRDDHLANRRGSGSLRPVGADYPLPHPPRGQHRPSPPLRRILVVIDTVVIALGWAVVMAVATSAGEITFGPLTAIAQVVIMLAAGGFLLSANGLYRRRVCAIRSVEVARIGRVSLAMTALAVVVVASFGRETALLAGICGGLTWFVMLALERGVFREWISGRRANGDFAASVLVVGGAAASTVETAHFLADHPVLGFRVDGVSCPESWQAKASRFPWFEVSDDLLEAVRRSGAAGVVLDSSSLNGDELNRIVHKLAVTDVHVHVSSGLRGIDVRRISVSPIADEAFFHIAPLGLSRRQLVAKRCLDVVGASIALFLTSPVVLVASGLVWAQDRAPVIFRQRRVGHGGEPFTLLKLRTMVSDAEQLLAPLEAANERSGPLFKLDRDPRVTPIGRLLRASSIDELPQLLNVLQGTMSLVGPRPALPAEVAQFDAQLNARLTVKPGITGLWQVEARDLPSFDLYRRYDLLYVQNWSIGLDLAIIARTCVVMVLRIGRAMLPGGSSRATAGP